MTPARYQQVGEIYHAALAAGRENRDTFLERACGEDVELRREVESLIKSHEEDPQFIAAPALVVAAKLLAESGTDELIGTTFARYKILSLLGAGGMGRVFLAEDAALGRRVALKFLPELFNNPTQVDRFRREARAASALNHPNILTVYEVGQVDGTDFIATEFIEGETMRARLNRGPMSFREALGLVIQIADALIAAHDAGIVHRDIKPDNLMIRRDGYVKVLDFGLAKLAENVSDSAPAVFMASTRHAVKTNPGMVMGTAEYMSPEQARGLAVDGRTDVWSLGVVVYEVLTGKRPFEAPTDSDTIASILEREPASLGRHDVPEELARIVTKALAKDRNERYQTVKDMAEELRLLRRRLEIEAEMASGADSRTRGGALPLPRARTNALVTAAVTSSVASLISEIREHKGRTALIGIALLVFLTGGTYLLSRAGQKFYRSLAGTDRALAHFRIAAVTRLTSIGKSKLAAISPDGKYVAYAVQDDRLQSLWVKQVVTGNSLQIVRPAKAGYWGLTFSNDSNYVYYVRNDESGGALNNLYEVPALGGIPKKLIEHVDSAVTFSPDGTRMAFLRDNLRAEETELIIANPDGSREQKLAVSKSPNRFHSDTATRIAWSPDSRIIACSAASPDAGSEYGSVVGVSVADGTTRMLTSKRWGYVSQVTWLSEGALAVVGSEVGSPYGQVWELSYAGGEVRRITNDLNHYGDVSVTRDSATLVTVQTNLFSNIWVAPAADVKRARQITSGTLDGRGGLTWMNGNKIVYKSIASGNPDIWIMDADGSNQKQLTHEGRNSQPRASADGKYIFFTSGQAGDFNVWRMDADGANLKKLTLGKANYNPYPSPDGMWILYVSADSGNGALWKMPADGGKPVQLTGPTVNLPIISPDGKRIALQYWDEHANPTRGVMILPFAGATPAKRLNIQIGADAFNLQWTPNGRALLYISGPLANIWRQPVDGGEPVQLTDFGGDQVFNFSYSPDGRWLAFARGRITDDVVLISSAK